MFERKGKTGSRVPESVDDSPILTEDGRPIAYITIGSSANRIECPLLQLGIGASMPIDELKDSFLELSHDYASVVINRQVTQGEYFSNDVLKVCMEIYNRKSLSINVEYFEFKNS